MYLQTNTQNTEQVKCTNVPRAERKGQEQGRQGRRAGEGHRWELSCHAEEFYLCPLLGWRRSCWTAASAAAMAAPASSRWVWVTLVLLWLRDGPWERRCPSEEDLELPGLLWDFSMVGICISGKNCGGEEGGNTRNTVCYSSPTSEPQSDCAGNITSPTPSSLNWKPRAGSSPHLTLLCWE